MRRLTWSCAGTWFLGIVLGAAVLAPTEAQIRKSLDRKFPLTFCPLDLAGWQDGPTPVDISFVAPSSSVRITFAAPNYQNGVHVNTHLDNVSVVLKSEFPDNLANVHLPSPGGNYYSCSFSPFENPNDATHAPSFVFTPFTWPGPAGPYSTTFDNTLDCWTGDVLHDPSLSAPRLPATEQDTTLGSLRLGKEGIYDTVSASRIVTGLSVGQEYVVFAWWHAEREDTPLTIAIDPAACLDDDGDGYVDCSGCAPCAVQGGQTCGDCDDAHASIHPGLLDANCDGIDQDCDGQTDEDFPGGCQCVRRPSGRVGWWRAEGSADDWLGSNDGAFVGAGVGTTTGLVDETFYFSSGPSGNPLMGYVELPDSSTLEFTSAMTFEAWILPTEVTSNHPIIGRLGDNVTPGSAYALHIDLNRALEATISGDGINTEFVRSAQAVVPTSGWSHVAMTFDSGVLRVHLNGEVVASMTSSVTSLYNQGTVHATIGRWWGGDEIVGYIDEPALYNRALTSEEIRVIYELGAAGTCTCQDTDQDGYRAGGTGLCPAGTQTDCNDNVAWISPGAPELCNGLDEDCDTVRDDGLPQSTFYLDADTDGYGRATVTIQACAPPPGYVVDATDCNDASAAIHPGAPDTDCDLVDQNCNGPADENFTSPPDGWKATPVSTSPGQRVGMSMVSLGDRVIVWGGFDNFLGLTNTGRIYRPGYGLTDAWTPTSTGSNVPQARSGHTAVWTNTEMIVWGGGGISGPLNTGARYNPTTDTWSPVSTTGAPDPRTGHTAVWTGTRMIVWGGVGSIYYSTGGIYNPATNTWSPMTAPSLLGRAEHTAIWTGTEMIVWGGNGLSGHFGNGARYNLAGNTWTNLPSSPLSPRKNHTAVWTGTQMVIYGGQSFVGFPAQGDTTGAIYDPVVGNWVWGFSRSPSRTDHTAVWDSVNGLMVIFGGQTGGGYLTSGAAYDPVAHAWTDLPTAGEPTARYDHVAAFMPDFREMIVWGGGGSTGAQNTGGRIVIEGSTCGLGECARASAYTCSVGVLGYGCTPGAPAGETCNGLDDDCDGTDDNGIPPPSGLPSLAETASGTDAVLSWPVVPGSTGYDVVTGALSSLRASLGDFEASVGECLGNDLASPTVADPSLPAVGDGTWHLVRAVNTCGGPGSYDSGAPSQQGSRDPELLLPPACP